MVAKKAAEKKAASKETESKDSGSGSKSVTDWVYDPMSGDVDKALSEGPDIKKKD